MVDITKEKFIRNALEVITKTKNKKSKIMFFIEKNYAIIVLIICFLILGITNSFLIYRFFKILSNL